MKKITKTTRIAVNPTTHEYIYGPNTEQYVLSENEMVIMPELEKSTWSILCGYDEKGDSSTIVHGFKGNNDALVFAQKQGCIVLEGFPDLHTGYKNEVYLPELGLD